MYIPPQLLYNSKKRRLYFDLILLSSYIGISCAKYALVIVPKKKKQ